MKCEAGKDAMIAVNVKKAAVGVGVICER